jgi:hypothetical protein
MDAQHFLGPALTPEKVALTVSFVHVDGGGRRGLAERLPCVVFPVRTSATFNFARNDVTDVHYFLGPALTPEEIALILSLVQVDESKRLEFPIGAASMIDTNARHANVLRFGSRRLQPDVSCSIR